MGKDLWDLLDSPDRLRGALREEVRRRKVTERANQVLRDEIARLVELLESIHELSE